MLFRICAAVMLIMISLAFPPLFFVTGPYITAYLANTGRRAHKMARQRDTFIAYQTQVNRDKAMRAW